MRNITQLTKKKSYQEEIRTQFGIENIKEIATNRTVSEICDYYRTVIGDTDTYLAFENYMKKTYKDVEQHEDTTSKTQKVLLSDKLKEYESDLIPFYCLQNNLFKLKNYASDIEHYLPIVQTKIDCDIPCSEDSIQQLVAWNMYHAMNAQNLQTQINELEKQLSQYQKEIQKENPSSVSLKVMYHDNSITLSYTFKYKGELILSKEFTPTTYGEITRFDVTVIERIIRDSLNFMRKHDDERIREITQMKPIHIELTIDMYSKEYCRAKRIKDDDGNVSIEILPSHKVFLFDEGGTMYKVFTMKDNTFVAHTKGLRQKDVLAYDVFVGMGTIVHSK